MDLSLSEEQRLLRDSVQSWAGKRYGFEFRNLNARSELSYSAEIWREMAAMGWLALPLPEAYGGLGGSPVDVSLLMEGLGRALVVEPYLAGILLGAALVAGAGSAAQCEAMLPAVAQGDCMLAFAHVERARAGAQPTHALPESSGWIVEGHKSVVLAGPTADHFVVSAHIRTARGGAGDMALFLVPADSAGLRRTDYRVVDGRGASDLHLEGVRVGPGQRLSGAADALSIIEAVLDRANALLLADSVACMQMLLETTVEYTKTRRQFGRPLADNQVLKHRMVRMAVCCEEARSMAMLAALKVEANPRDRARAVSGAKVKVVECARFVAEQAVQLHGAIGLTEELVVGAYYKRLLVNESLLGPAAAHFRRYQALTSFDGAIAT